MNWSSSNESFSTYARRHIPDRSFNYPITRRHGAQTKSLFCRRMLQIALQTGFWFKPAPHPPPLQLPRLYPLAGNQQWSSRFPLKLGKQPLHGSGKTVQYQERKYAYGLEESDSPLQELVHALVCSDDCTGLDNATSLPLQPIDKPEGVLHGFYRPQIIFIEL